MHGKHESFILPKEDFKSLYEINNGFLPEQDINHPLLSADGVSNYYADLEEGCSLLITNNPEFVRIPESEQ